MFELTDVDFSDLADEDVANLLLQRTGYMSRSPEGRPAAFLDWMKGDDRALAAEAVSRRSEILSLHQREVLDEVEVLRRHLPNPFASVADIGAGLGLLDLALARNFDAAVHLIDIESTPHRYHQYALQAAGYSRLGTARRMMIRNGVPAENITVTNPRIDILVPGNYDAIISCLAMGFHFPCEEYRVFVERGLRPGGVCIFDHRHETDQSAFLQLFDRVDVVFEAPRFRRLACRRQSHD